VDPSAGYKTLPGIGLRQFLMPDRFADDGFLFAFVAYFVAETPVRLQVWRPVGDPSSTDHYQLVCQQRVDVTADQLSQRIVVRITPLRLNSTTRARPDPRGPACTDFVGDPGRKKVRVGPVGSGRARVVEFSYHTVLR